MLSKHFLKLRSVLSGNAGMEMGRRQRDLDRAQGTGVDIPDFD